MKFRTTNVRKSAMSSVVALFGVAAALVAPVTASAMVITFDELSAADGIFIPQGYQGFSWLGGQGGSSWVNNIAAPIDSAGAYSGDNYAWSNGGTNLDMADGGSFDAVSVWLRTREDIATSPFTIEGWSGANLLFSTAVNVTNVWTQVSLNFVNIDRLAFSVGRNLLIDDIRLNDVPEPSTLALLGLAMAGLGVARRNKQ